MDIKRELDERNRHKLQVDLTLLLVRLAESEKVDQNYQIPPISGEQLALLGAVVQKMMELYK